MRREGARCGAIAGEDAALDKLRIAKADAELVGGGRDDVSAEERRLRQAEELKALKDTLRNSREEKAALECAVRDAEQEKKHAERGIEDLRRDRDILVEAKTEAMRDADSANARAAGMEPALESERARFRSADEWNRTLSQQSEEAHGQLAAALAECEDVRRLRAELKGVNEASTATLRELQYGQCLVPESSTLTGDVDSGRPVPAFHLLIASVQRRIGELRAGVPHAGSSSPAARSRSPPAFLLRGDSRPRHTSPAVGSARRATRSGSLAMDDHREAPGSQPRSPLPTSRQGSDALEYYRLRRSRLLARVM